MPAGQHQPEQSRFGNLRQKIEVLGTRREAGAFSCWALCGAGEVIAEGSGITVWGIDFLLDCDIDKTQKNRRAETRLTWATGLRRYRAIYY